MVKILIRAVVLAGVILGLVAGAGAAPPLSVSTFSELADKATNVDAELGLCPQGENIRVFFRDPTIPGSYAYFYAGETRVSVWAYWPIPEQLGPPAEVAVGKVDSAKMDVIPALKWRPYDPAEHGTSPCDLLYPKQA